VALRNISCSNAVSEALAEEMQQNETVFVIGEDLTAHGGVFGQFKGLLEKYRHKLIDTPISETCIIGSGIGAALTGMRPFVDMHFTDFLTVGMDEIVNQMAKIRYMSGGQVKLPLVIWAVDGGGLSAAAQHSQCLESWFVHTPGLKVVVPSEPADVKGLIKAAVRDDDPVMVFQHKKLLAKVGSVPEGDHIIPLGQATVKREGKDISLICYGVGYYLCLEAAEILDGENINVEIIDLRTLKPLDMDTVSQSISKTHRAVIVHEACLTGGFGSEMAARIQDELFDELDAPIKRVGAKDVPIPFSPPLENFVLPSARDVVLAAQEVMYR